MPDGNLMVEFHNFLASWQLYPERGVYEIGGRPKSAIYRIEKPGDLLTISMNWVTLEDHGFQSSYTLIPNGEWQPFADTSIADTVRVLVVSREHFETQFAREKEIVLVVEHRINTKGLLEVTTHHQKEPIGKDVEVYHKQLSVLPYAASVGSVAIRKTEEGMIRHQALQAMDEQTNMQLNQIRKQVELLAAQAREIQRRKELSFLIYDSKLPFAPVIGQAYFLYEKEDEGYLLSLIGPSEWGRRGVPYKRYVARVKLLADHTWVEVEEQTF